MKTKDVCGRRIILEGEKRRNICSGVSPLGPSKKVKAAIRKALKNLNAGSGRSLRLFGGLLSARFGLREEMVLCANSREELLSLIRDVFGPGKVLLPGPVPRICKEWASADAVSVNATEGSGFRFTPEGVKENLGGVGLVYISNPNRVTGLSVDKKDIFEAARFAASRKVAVVVDESLCEFTGDDSFSPDISGQDNIIILRTTADFYGLTGLELAFAVSSAATIGRLKQKFHGKVSVLAVEAARAAYKDRAYRKNLLAFVEEEKRLFERSLRKIAGVKLYDSNTNVFLIKVEGYHEKMAGIIESAGFSVEECLGVRDLGPHFLRMSVMSHENNLKFLRLLKKIVLEGA